MTPRNPKADPAEAVPTPAELNAEADVEAAPAKPSKAEIVAECRDANGNPTERVFSKEVHSADFAKLADELVDQR